jgi:hypothetical protein
MTSPPILLFGMPRSGTTWIGKIFDSAPNTLYRHEPDSWGSLDHMPLFPDVSGLSPELTRQALEYLAILVEARKTKVAGSLPIFPKLGRTGPGLRFRQSGVMAVKALSNYLGELNIPGWLEPDSKRLRPVWKSIESLGRLGVFLRADPALRGIHILRHPCGFVSSVLRGERKNKFGGGKDSEDFGMFGILCELPGARRRGLTPADFRTMSPAGRLAWRWLLVNEKAMDDCSGLGNYLAVNYDQICAAPVDHARKMYEFAELAWNQQTESFVSASTGHELSAYYSVFKDPLKSANKWKTELDEGEIREVLNIIQDSKPGRMFVDATS